MYVPAATAARNKITKFSIVKISRGCETIVW